MNQWSSLPGDCLDPVYRMIQCSIFCSYWLVPTWNEEALRHRELDHNCAQLEKEMIWPAQWAHLAKMGFCEREQHLLWIELSCVMGLDLMEGTRLFWGIPRAWNESLAPTCCLPSWTRSLGQMWKARGLHKTETPAMLFCLGCVVLLPFLFQHAIGERENYLKIPLLGHSHSWPELPAFWSGGKWGASRPSKLIWRQTITAEASSQWQVTATLEMIVLNCLEYNQMHARKAWVSSCFQGFTG